MSMPALPPKLNASPPVDWSTRSVVALMFPRTRSSAYAAAVVAARGAELSAAQDQAGAVRAGCAWCPNLTSREMT